MTSLICTSRSRQTNSPLKKMMIIETNRAVEVVMVSTTL